eukprot:CAMPEP_0183360758 /NCGR_PEP_ID=MMETSP0164_2-20130417/56056_1 /TAXON_ID=221442 /ORGANISM="Coccolithus pelagicus ssp braarudi, Strain PLY182g" /LENGTH=146 /DNA_ID=CAMNT_0025535185 /DNA_START=26 /DNA_END=469 /DNA_ORIENTATION=+
MAAATGAASRMTRVLKAQLPPQLRAKLGPPPLAANAMPVRQKRLPPNMERKIREKAFLIPLEDIPSGPKPFHVMRSRMGNYPIYTDVRNGGSKVVTILRKFGGDVEALKSELQAVTGKTVATYHGRLEVNGRHQPILSKWLHRLGF